MLTDDEKKALLEFAGWKYKRSTYYDGSDHRPGMYWHNSKGNLVHSMPQITQEFLFSECVPRFDDHYTYTYYRRGKRWVCEIHGKGCRAIADNFDRPTNAPETALGRAILKAIGGR